jgi:hypothetical protein
MKNLWYGLLAVLPPYGFYNGANQYGYVDGVYQKLPFSFANGMYGLLAGVLIAGILYGLTRLFVSIRARLRK